MVSMRGKKLKYFRNHFTMLEMTSEFEKRLIYVGNDVYIFCELAYVYDKRLKYVGNEIDLFEMTQICGEIT